MGIQNELKRLFINRTVKSAWGFSPGQKVRNATTVLDVSLYLLADMLIKHARRLGPIDEPRALLLDRVHGHFSEHVMFTEFSLDTTIGHLAATNSDYDSIGQYAFERRYEQCAAELGRQLPELVRRQMIARLALFQRVDLYHIETTDKIETIRDEHGLLFGFVTQKDIETILNMAAGAVLEPRRRG